MRFASSLIALLVCVPALAGCASDGGLFGSSGPKKPEAASNAPAKPADSMDMAADIETSVQRAQQARLSGNYEQAIHSLSQLMMVASDDHRVVGEYGKTLAENGRAQEAVQFLSRAVALQPSEWSYYSALGVAYDQVGDQNSARTAYEQALKLRPNDPAVLNNYALSRMLAKDPDGARALMQRAEKAGGASDPKIARNIELVDKLAPPALKAAVETAPVQSTPVPAPTPVTSQELPAAQNIPVATKVVMQPVPSDPQAGPAKPAKRVPTQLATHAAKPPAPKPEIREAHADTKKPVTDAKAETKPAAKTAKADAQPAKAQTVAVRAVKAEPGPVKAAEAKPETKAPAKPAKDGIPALRQTASAY